ncbi:MAG: tRNA (adenosine(37)-N6)-threonylcarbamoyltransferase complex transferase subunit TsaD [Acidobacteria bacterium RBG_16_70_10]|nr:MAG: tRNA (adenosine(37)-N6)-threonylcarbamoyltransferase complex transferase subunit TsaD [Acidobacteria bacterium RBG_16_70_10]
MALVLGIETSCDETAAAVVEDSRRILSSVVSSQSAVHAPYGGVVPELASRHHIENICPVIELAMKDAATTFSGLEAVAVTQGPGLVGSLLVGVQAAKGIAFVHKRPLVPVHHVAGHVQATFLAHRQIPLPALALVVSGGHTSLYAVPEEGVFRLLGRTRDDAAGEAFDKVAKLLGLGYPGGPIIDSLSRGANDQAVEFTVARIKDGRSDFSFSGIKTAVLLHVRREGIPPVEDPSRPSGEIRDLVASFQRTVVTALVRGLVRAAEEHRPASLLLTGGVAANSLLREEATRAAGTLGVPIFIPPPDLSTDNAAMIAAAGFVNLRRGLHAGWDLNAEPHLPLG